MSCPYYKETKNKSTGKTYKNCTYYINNKLHCINCILNYDIWCILNDKQRR